MYLSIQLLVNKKNLSSIQLPFQLRALDNISKHNLPA